MEKYGKLRRADPGQDLNLRPPEYDIRMLFTGLQHSLT
jgi:hypothetical protein